MFYLLLFLCFFIPLNSNALELNAKSSVLIDSDTNTILYEYNKDERLPMASMTKMMTLLILMEHIDSGKVKLSDDVIISKNAASMGGSQAYLEENSKMKLDVLIKAICIASANDAAVAVAEYISGSTDDFIKLMNNKVKELRLKNTHFSNVHGLDQDNHYSSAYDMAIIASHLLKHDLILKYSSIYEDYIKHPNGVNTWVVNTNKLINHYEGLDGLKTGYTKNSGYCITATAKRNNLRLISVVMGESSNKVRNEDTINLLNYGFSNYRVEKVIDDSKLGDIDILFGKKNKVKLKLIDSGFHLVKNGDKYNYSYEIIKDKIKAPVKVGDVVGKVNIYSNSVKIDTLKLTIFEEVKRANFFDLYGDNLRLLLKGYK